MFKFILGPIRYGRRGDYDAASYWRDRLVKYGSGLRGAGHEGLSEAANAYLNDRAGEVLLSVLRGAGLELPRCAVLDIGPGRGFATRILYGQGVRSYMGLDITDALFELLQAEFPAYNFQRGDITERRPGSEFDLILMLDVLEHIVDESRLSSALANASASLAATGVLALALPTRHGNPKPFFYLRFWDRQELRSRLPGMQLSDPIAWRDGVLILCTHSGHEPHRTSRVTG